MATYAELNALYKDAAFLGKVEVAIIKYTDYILSESTATDNHTKRWNWAVQAAQNGPSLVAARIAPNVSWDATIQAQLAAATDAQIQSAVEAWINRLLQF
jgi:hypothetical protein